MSRRSLAFSSAVAAAALLAGCAAPAKPRAPSRSVSAAQRTADDQAFYRAVSDYVQGDYQKAQAELSAILRADPGNRDALALRRRVYAAQRVSAR